MSLEKEDPLGRLDVAAYRCAQRLTNELEAYWGIGGLWEAIAPLVESGIEDIKLKRLPEPLVEAVGKIIEAKGKNDARG